MAACVLCRRLPRLRYLPGLKNDFSQTVPVKQEDETDDHEGKKGASQQQELPPPGAYRLYYNPSSYHHSVQKSAASLSQTDNDVDEQRLSTVAPSFWQQSNRYSVSCSRHLSSSKNTLLDLAFNKSEKETISPDQRKPTEPDVKVNPRAFHKCRPGYASMTVDLTQRPDPIEWEDATRVLQKVTVLKGSMKPSDVSEFLAELSRLHPDMMPLVRSDQRFIMLLRYSVEHLRLFTELQLLEVLRSFVWLDMPSAHTVLELFEAELIRRVHQMSLHQQLFAADLWRCIGRQVPRFLKHLYDSVNLHLGLMGIPELVQLLYIIGEGRRCPKDMVRPVEQLLMCHLQRLYPEEVGVVCLALFKSQTSISEGALTRLMDKAHSVVREMGDFEMVNVLKFLRFSYCYHKAWMQAMTQEVPLRAQRMGVQGLMHVALTCSSMHFRNDDILMAIAERVPSLVPHCRSKDSCKLLWAFGTLGFLPTQSPSLYPSLTEAVRRTKAEIQRYPEHLLTGLLGLAFVSQFPEDLIALALSPDFVKLSMKQTHLEMKKDLFTLDETVALELPHWSGPRLSCELREEVTELLWKFAQSDVCHKPEVLEAESALQDLLGGEEYVLKRMILPHTRSIDLEIHLDSTGEPIPVKLGPHTTTLSPEKSPPHRGWEKNIGVSITDELLGQLINSKPLATPPVIRSVQRVVPDEVGLFDTGRNLTKDIIDSLVKPSSRGLDPGGSKGTVRLAIQVSNKNHYCHPTKQLLGLHAMKRRQLKLAGYRVVELSCWDWLPLLKKSKTEKLAHLHCLVYNSL